MFDVRTKATQTALRCSARVKESNCLKDVIAEILDESRSMTSFGKRGASQKLHSVLAEMNQENEKVKLNVVC